MNYNDLIHELFNVNLFGGTKLGLDNVQYLQQLLDFPDRSFASVHVAGTNGKGSVSTKIARAFQEAGYRVGLFTSPHISSFRERIRINGVMISEKSVESLLYPLFKIAKEARIPATFFELTTLLAFLFFAEEQTEIAIIETGIGGRLDATNIIRPCLSIITSIGLDHTEILGSTKESIALEKAGIIKDKIPVVLGPHVPLECLMSILSEKQSPWMQVQETSPLFEVENCTIARMALNYLSSHFDLPLETIHEGMKGKQPCRFEIIQDNPLTILDVAHNPDGFRSLFQAIKYHYSFHSLRVVVGLSKNKDLGGCLEILAQHSRHIHFVEASNGRGASPGELSTYLHRLSNEPLLIHTHESIINGVQLAQKEALKMNQILIICGSFFIMRESRQALGIIETCDDIDLNERQGSEMSKKNKTQVVRIK